VLEGYLRIGSINLSSSRGGRGDRADRGQQATLSEMKQCCLPETLVVRYKVLLTNTACHVSEFIKYSVALANLCLQMPNQFPKVRPHEQPKTATSVLFTSLGGVVIAGAIYGLTLWCLLLVLRQADVISEIVSYRWCVVISYIYVLFRSYDKQLFSKK